MTESQKVRRVRDAVTNQHPDLAAEAAVRRFERDAIPIPSSLVADEAAAPWKVQQMTDAAEAYRDVVIAGCDGAVLDQVLAGWGKQRRADALKMLRASEAVIESREARPNINGRVITRVVLTARDSD